MNATQTPKLSLAQKRMLASVNDGEVFLHFDVWSGYWWTERRKRLPAYGNGKSDNFPPLPIRYLEADRLIRRGALEHIASGAHKTPYVITDAGRAALASQTGG